MKKTLLFYVTQCNASYFYELFGELDISKLFPPNKFRI
jgi:hypothetical protein